MNIPREESGDIMFKIEDSEMSIIIHDLIRVAGILKQLENGSLTEGQRQILHGCETRLIEIRQHILTSAKTNNDNEKGGN